MKYEIGQKVTTPLGDGEIIDVFTREDKTIKEYKVCINTYSVWVDVEDLKPYKTPHEKLLEMGYELDDRIDVKIYRHDTLSYVRVYDDNTISCFEITLELLHILTDYLEWLEEQK